MDKVYKTIGYITKKQEWKEDDLLFSIFTQDFGKVRLLTVGARKIKSKLAGHLHNPGLVEIEYVRGRSIKRLINAYAVDRIKLVTEYQFKYWQALTSLLQAILPDEEKNIYVYELTQWLVSFWQKNDDEELYKLGFNIFLIKAITHLGYQIQIDKLRSREKELADLILQIQGSTKSISLQLKQKENHQLFKFIFRYLQNQFEQSFPALSNL